MLAELARGVTWRLSGLARRTAGKAADLWRSLVTTLAATCRLAAAVAARVALVTHVAAGVVNSFFDRLGNLVGDLCRAVISAPTQSERLGRARKLNAGHCFGIVLLQLRHLDAVESDGRALVNSQTLHAILTDARQAHV